MLFHNTLGLYNKGKSCVLYKIIHPYSHICVCRMKYIPEQKKFYNVTSIYMGIMDVFSMTWSVCIVSKNGSKQRRFLCQTRECSMNRKFDRRRRKIGNENHGIIYYLKSEKD